MKALKLSLGIAIVALLASSCSSLRMPKGTSHDASKGYSSARLVKTSGQLQNNGSDESPLVNNAIERSIRNQFKTRGLTFGSPGAELIVAYMMIGNDAGMPKDYFGGGRDVNAIIEDAYKSGTIKNKRPDAFKSGSLVIDIIDAKTNKLVYRKYTRKDLLGGVKPMHRDARINETVVQMLSPFFK